MKKVSGAYRSGEGRRPTPWIFKLRMATPTATQDLR